VAPLCSDHCQHHVMACRDTFATTIRAISGLSRQTPSLRMTKSAGSKTRPLTKFSTARSILGRSGSIKSKMNFDDLSLRPPRCPGNGLDPSFAFERGIGVIQYRIDRVRRIAIRERAKLERLKGVWKLARKASWQLRPGSRVPPAAAMFTFNASG
jgi:hypothetical protein